MYLYIYIYIFVYMHGLYSDTLNDSDDIAVSDPMTVNNDLYGYGRKLSRLSSISLHFPADCVHRIRCYFTGHGRDDSFSKMMVWRDCIPRRQSEWLSGLPFERLRTGFRFSGHQISMLCDNRRLVNFTPHRERNVGTLWIRGSTFWRKNSHPCLESNIGSFKP